MTTTPPAPNRPQSDPPTDARMVKVFDLPPGCNIRRVALRETDGNDERLAALAMSAKGKGETTITEELIEFSLVAYWDRSGRKVSSTVGEPLGVFGTWNTKTRDLVLLAFDQLNGTPADQKMAFLLGAQLAGPNGEPLASDPVVEAEPPNE